MYTRSGKKIIRLINISRNVCPLYIFLDIFSGILQNLTSKWAYLTTLITAIITSNNTTKQTAHTYLWYLGLSLIHAIMASDHDTSRQRYMSTLSLITIDICDREYQGHFTSLHAAHHCHCKVKLIYWLTYCLWSTHVSHKINWGRDFLLFLYLRQNYWTILAKFWNGDRLFYLGLRLRLLFILTNLWFPRCLYKPKFTMFT